MRTQLYSFSRRFYTSLDAINQPVRQYYFVDTNIIVGYVRDQYDGIRDFIENHDRRFFYTETVKKELEKSKMDFPISEKYFEYVSSDLTEKHKETALELLKELCSKHFTESHNPLIVLTDKQIKNFHNDLFIIFESGYARYNKLPKHVYGAELLTNNLRLYKKFLADTEKQEIIEQTVNLSGFEHLIDVKLLLDAIKEDKKPKTTNIINCKI